MNEDSASKQESFREACSDIESVNSHAHTFMIIKNTDVITARTIEAFAKDSLELFLKSESNLLSNIFILKSTKLIPNVKNYFLNRA
ncbi:hypothetical protein FACS189472_01070 [Alphaproteobacteria bacterium]|nr:hypothetical protein FACS189472_01070 [Alphaproteobacteria bacterium]